MIFRRLLLSILFIAGILSAQGVYTRKDAEICASKFSLAADKNLKEKPLNEIIETIGKSFLGVDYEAGSLEIPGDEQLVVHLTGLDCYTFLENTLVLSRCIKEGRTGFDDYLKELKNIRYRGGRLTDYTSRLHYFTDWIYDCSKRGIVTNITKEIGGVSYYKIINFMSTHPASYRQLKENPEFVETIKIFEQEISKRRNYYIPEEKLEETEGRIKSGDLIAITTSIEGLDVSHVGIAVKKEDGRIYLLHAPSPGKKVQVSEMTLEQMLKANKKQTGVIVVRVN